MLPLHACAPTQLLSCVRLCSPMGCSPPGPSSTGFSRRGYWSGLPFPPPGGLPHPGAEPGSLNLLHSQVCSVPLVPPGKPTVFEHFLLFLVPCSLFENTLFKKNDHLVRLCLAAQGLHCCLRVSHCGGFSCCRAWVQLSSRTGSFALWPVDSSWARD